jgi:CRP-like cAMP-binding protein
MDVISITNHRETPKELLRRRFAAVLPSAGEAIEAHINLTANRRTVPCGDKIAAADETPSRVWLLASGVAGDVRMLADGRRQVISLRLPGDILQADAQEAIVALSPVEIVDAFPTLRALGEKAPSHQPLRQAWLAASRLEQALLRDHLVRLGCLSAYERMAHFLMETYDRLSRVGLATPTAFHLPVRQDVVADLMGLSVVHVSRTMQTLRREGLAFARSSYVTLPDRERLAAVSGYVSRFAASGPVAPRYAGAPKPILSQGFGAGGWDGAAQPAVSTQP